MITTTMNVTMEEKKIEAIKRMKAMNVFNETIKQFKDDGYICISEPPFGAFYWVEEEALNKIREFEKEHNALVYMVVRCYSDFGVLDNYLFVSDYKEEWEMDMEILKNNEVFAYVNNLDAPDCSEFGYIGIQRTVAAGLKRVW